MNIILKKVGLYQHAVHNESMQGSEEGSEMTKTIILEITTYNLQTTFLVKETLVTKTGIQA